VVTVYDYHEELGPKATMDESHREWHRNSGVPMGVPGCPQDACHVMDDDGCPWCGEPVMMLELEAHVEECAVARKELGLS